MSFDIACNTALFFAGANPKRFCFLRFLNKILIKKKKREGVKRRKLEGLKTLPARQINDVEIYFTRKRFSVVNAFAGSRLGNFTRQNRQPGWARSGLLFESAGESSLNVVQAESTNCRAHQTSSARGKSGVESRIVTRNFINTLCKQAKQSTILVK